MSQPGRGEAEGSPSVHAQMLTGAHLREGWDALGMMLSAMLVFGLPSWWLSEATGQVWVIPVALVLGMAAALASIWVRYGVHGPDGQPPRSRAAASRAAGTHPPAEPADGG